MFAVGWIYSSVLFFAVKRGRICMNMYKLINLNKRRRVCKMEIWLRDISVYISGLNNVGQTCFTWRIMAWYNFYTPDVRISSRAILNLNLNIYLTSRVQQKSGFLAQQKLVGGLEHFFIFPNSWDDDPIWRTYIFQGRRYTTNQTCSRKQNIFIGAIMINPVGEMVVPPGLEHINRWRKP